MRRRCGVRPDVPLEAEAFTRELLRNYKGGRDTLANWYGEQLELNYRSLDDPPEWIQDPEWAFDGGRPMVFVGQLERTVDRHGTLVFYIFWNPKTGATKVVTQAD